MPWQLVELDPDSRSNGDNLPPLQLRFIASTAESATRIPLKPHIGSKQPRQANADLVHHKVSDQAWNRPQSLAGKPPLNLLSRAFNGSAPQLHLPTSEIGIAFRRNSRPSPRVSPRIQGTSTVGETAGIAASRVPTPRLKAAPSPRLPSDPGPSNSHAHGSGLQAPLPVAFHGGVRTPRSRIEDDQKRTQEKNAIALLIKRLQDKRWNARKNAVDSLASLAEYDPGVMEAVMGQIESKSGKNRQTAVWAIARIFEHGDRNLIENLLYRLEHPVSDVRLAALSALGQVVKKGDELTLFGVATRLCHSDWNVREVAVDALVQVAEKGHGPTLKLLAQTLKDSDWRVRWVAVDAIESMFENSLPGILYLLDYLKVSVKEGSKGNSKALEKLQIRVFDILVKKAKAPASVRCRPCLQREKTADLEAEELCCSCVQKINWWVQTSILPSHWLAFLMGGHDRLGQDSPIYSLDFHLLPMIIGFCRSDVEL